MTTRLELLVFPMHGICTPMTNKITIGLAIVIVAFLIIDQMFYDGEARFFLAKKFLDFLSFLAFWR